MPKQRMSKPQKKKDVSIREGADIERENRRRESHGGMDEAQDIEREAPSDWREQGEGDQNE
jgi:hypothetical protein